MLGQVPIFMQQLCQVSSMSLMDNELELRNGELTAWLGAVLRSDKWQAGKKMT
jgi:hypothetical protein